MARDNSRMPTISPDLKHEVVSQAIACTPSVLAVFWTKVLDLSIDNWLGLSGIAFILLQASYLIWKWRRDAKRPRRVLDE